MSISLESLLPIQGDRDELLQLLNVIATEWHENEEAFEHRTLAEWPKWCEELGFRFDVLHKLATNLEDALNYPEGSGGIKQCIAALGPAATAPQLLVSLSQQLPEFLEGFAQLLQISQEESQALGSEAGGTAKQWIKDHPAWDAIAGASVLVGGGIGFEIRRRYVRARQELNREESEAEQIIVEDWDHEDNRQLALWQRWFRGDNRGKDESIITARTTIAEFAEEASEEMGFDVKFIEDKALNRELSRGENAIGKDIDSSLIQSAEARVKTNVKTEAMHVEEDVAEDINKEVETLLDRKVKRVEDNIEENMGSEMIDREAHFVDD